MGMLTTGGAPLQWGSQANNEHIHYVLEHGIRQFLNIWRTKKDMRDCPFIWGEEIEHVMVRRNANGELKLALNAADIIHELCARPSECDWRPEYGSFMVESVPLQPYGTSAEALESVETNIATRVRMIDEAGDASEFGVLMVSYPLMGVGNFTDAGDVHDAPYSRSIFVPDICINGTHPRFATLTQNIRLRRGRKVCIQVPMFIDKYTLERSVDPRFNIDATPVNDAIDCQAMGDTKKTKKFGAPAGSNGAGPASPVTSSPKVASSAPRGSDASSTSTNVFADEMAHLFTPATDYYYAQYEPTADRSYNVVKRYEACPCPVPSVSHPCIYMDCMAFGMGLHCLQVTMQLRDVDEARHIYDQLHVLCAPFLALSAATPFQKGMLCDSDVRWLTIAASVDDRQRQEVPRILKSRYDTVSTYISPLEKNVEAFNDNHVEVNQKFFDQLRAEGIDERLAKHIAHLFIRDPLTIFEAMIQIDDEKRSDHFENIQSTNWQNMRFKPPPPGTDIGWRVEFRIMDVQPTPFENAAYSVFVVLLARAILKYKARTYLKMTLTEINLGRAHRRDACRTQKFYFRKNIFATGDISAADDEVVQLSIDEIFNGAPAVGFEGLVAVVRQFCAEEGIVSSRIDAFIDLISLRAAGKLPTVAQFMREFVLNHPDYKQDSRLTQRISDDIVDLCHSLGRGDRVIEEFIPASLVHGKKRRRDGDESA